jgi:hypothetical protein
MNEITAAIIGAAIPVVIAAIYRLITIGSSLPRRVARLEDGLVMLIEVNEGQTDGIIASLIAQREGRCNGEITEALDALKASKAKSRAFLASKAVGRR